MPRKKKDLPIFVVVDMPKWKAKIIDAVTRILFPGEKYFVLTVLETGLKYEDKEQNEFNTYDVVI